jgi:branched-chain amino acid transport system ATP-binding protein
MAIAPAEGSGMTATILAADGVSQNFGGIRAIDNLSLALKEGEIVALIGPNGAGKTTLVNLMTGVHRPSSGRIRFEGVDVTAQRPFEAARRGLARTFQIVQPFPRMSVLENVAAGALFGGAQPSVAAAMAVAREELEFTGLAQFADRPASALTLAGRKRLELAKSMAMRPKVIMLDEVNAGLNASEIDGALRLIRQIAERGVTVLIIEHLMKVVMSHHGQLIAEGSAAEIVRNTRVVEAYLGEKFARRFAAEGSGG